ncbi:uncharacterized protein LOC142639358 [Castanea sativa]|uniref:uncharacterized protein LOC142639358 n=1 Tax=Castanea sativa TaxID=21020 RepID=UPI003F64C1C1
MSRPPLYSFYLLFCFFFLLSGIRSDDLQILMKLKSTLLQTSNTSAFNSWESSNSMCNFTGITCSSQGSVTKIKLSHQNLTGVLPLDFICQLQSLEKLSLGFNHLNGPIMDDLKNCVKLQYLYLDRSGLSQTFPWKSLQNMTSLVQLYLGNNPFNPFPFPKEVLQLTNLTWLDLCNCSIHGTIPAEIGKLKELIYLGLQDNNMTGKIPVEIGNLVNLRKLSLSHNSFMGKLPVGLRNLTKLEVFHFSMNNLEGDLSELRFLNNLVSIRLSENELSGQVPAEFGEFKKLVNLSLYYNSFTGPLPQNLGSSAKLYIVNLSMNFFTGQIPPYMCKQGTLSVLSMFGNNLTGEIPASYANCSTLLDFRVNNNSLSGTIPSGIWGLPHLLNIDIKWNSIEGPITSDIKNAKSLATLYAGHNRLSGELPAEISKATSLKFIQLSDNQLLGRLQSKLKRILTIFTAIDLSSNKFEGEIPKVLGKLTVLRLLNLSHNSLTSHIPLSLANLSRLESLDLSSNRLTGRIPIQLTSLTFLAMLNLSQNQLTGPIPQGKQFDTFENNSYNGNLGLCGFPLSVNCSTNELLSPPLPSILQEHNDSIFASGFDWKVVLIGYGCGLLFGLAMGCVVFNFKRGIPKWLLRYCQTSFGPNQLLLLGKIHNWRRFLVMLLKDDHKGQWWPRRLAGYYPEYRKEIAKDNVLMVWTKSHDLCALLQAEDAAVLWAIQLDIGENWKQIIIEGESPMNINLTGLLQLLLVTSFTIESPY